MFSLLFIFLQFLWELFHLVWLNKCNLITALKFYGEKMYMNFNTVDLYWEYESNYKRLDIQAGELDAYNPWQRLTDECMDEL